jgi:hypothetical protein
LWLAGKKPLTSPSDAADFMKAVGFALRYNATPSLPLAAMYKAAGETRLAIELTNALLASREVVESNIIAGRLVLIHRDIVPEVFALRKRRRAAKLSEYAERALALIRDEGHATSGEVRRFLGIGSEKRPDAADLALAELQSELRIDRGPSSVPKKGIPYLSPEGFPYRIFEEAHPDLVRKAAVTKPEDAGRRVIEKYLSAAIFVTPRKLLSLFRLLLSETEMNSALDALNEKKKIQRDSKQIRIQP